MQVIRSLAQVVTVRNTMSPALVHIRGLMKLSPPKPPMEVEYPERMKLKLIEKVPQYPPHVRVFKMQKRLKLMRGPEEIHNTLLHKQYGVMALGGGRMTHRHFEFIRIMIARQKYKNIFALYRVDAPWQPVTKKSQGQRMGGGKGSVHHYVTPVKAGRVILEMGGHCEFYEVERVLKAIATAMPFKAMAVSQDILDTMKKKEEELEAKNLNPWTWKYIVQNNLGGCHRWIGPYDKFWFNKHM